MATKRTPIKRALQTRITAEAIDAFKAWRAVGECLNPDDEGYDCGECDVCEHGGAHTMRFTARWGFARGFGRSARNMIRCCGRN